MEANRVVLVFAGGDPIPPTVAARLPRNAYVVAADSGLEHARALGRSVDLVVGDMDSVSKGGLAQAEREGAVIERHEADKDQTDLELALDAAVARGAAHITVVGGHGGRVDHFLGNALLLASPAYGSVTVDALVGRGRMHIIRDERSLPALPGELCTLLPVHGPAEGVRTRGLRWSLDDEVLAAGTSRGLSNVVEADTVTVALRRGVLLVLFPGERAARG